MTVSETKEEMSGDNERCLYKYDDRLSIYDGYILERSCYGYYQFRKQDNDVTEIIDYINYAVMKTQHGYAIYSKHGSGLYVADYTYYVLYDSKMYWFCDEEYTFGVYIDGYSRSPKNNRSIKVRSLADFVRFLRYEQKIEYDPKKVDHGTIVYRRKREPTGISKTNRLSDIIIRAMINKKK